MDDPKEDNNQKEDRGTEDSESWERHSWLKERLFSYAWTAIQCLTLIAFLSFVAKKMNQKNKLSLPQSQT